MTAGRPSREAVARWNVAYAEHITTLFAVMRTGAVDAAAVHGLASTYHQLADAWRVLAADLGAPLWARHAATIAAIEFDRRGYLEARRAPD